MRAAPKRHLIAVGLVAATLLTFLVPTAASPALASDLGAKAHAAAAVGFDPANIISDSAFFDSNAMTQSQIQSFLDSMIGTCSNGNCLNVKRTDTTSKPADPMCRPYVGATGELASTILFKVQQACGVSAKVLLVTLQKEQSLVTHQSPTLGRLDRAMGYGCPDNVAQPGWCDPEYGGLFNQVYLAARQFQRYGNPPGTSNYFTWFPVGSPSQVQYNPNPACGASTLVIQNRATAALYYYTPYQPNAAALANLGGLGDGCSAYGNRNFWDYYSRWFGSPTLPSGTPLGAVTRAAGVQGGIALEGWGIDPNVPSSAVQLSVWVDSLWNYSWSADRPFPANLTGMPAAGSNHGFGPLVPAAPGNRTVCIYLVNQGPGIDILLECRTVVVPQSMTPSGYVKAETVAGGALLTGWAYDPDANGASVTLSVWVDDLTNIQRPADQPSNAYGALKGQFPSAGSSHGISSRIALAPGDHKVCFYLVNKGAGADVALSCQTVKIPFDPSPKGEVLSVAGVSGGVSVSGWSIDPDVLTSPVRVSLWLDSRQNFQWTADQSYPAGEASFPGAGVNHGFSGVIPASPGVHTVCVYAFNQGAGSDAFFSCHTVTVP